MLGLQRESGGPGGCSRAWGPDKARGCSHVSQSNSDSGQMGPWRGVWAVGPRRDSWVLVGRYPPRPAEAKGDRRSRVLASPVVSGSCHRVICS